MDPLCGWVWLWRKLRVTAIAIVVIAVLLWLAFSMNGFFASVLPTPTRTPQPTRTLIPATPELQSSELFATSKAALKTQIAENEVSAPPNCIYWDQLTREFIGKSVYVYGYVATYYDVIDEKNGFHIYGHVLEFDPNNPNAYVVNMTEHRPGRVAGLKDNNCIMAEGFIEFEETHLYMNVKDIKQCP